MCYPSVNTFRFEGVFWTKFTIEKRSVIRISTIFILRVFFGQFLQKKIVFTTIFKTCWKFTLKKVRCYSSINICIFSTVFDVFMGFFGQSSCFEFMFPPLKFTLFFISPLPNASRCLFCSSYGWECITMHPSYSPTAENDTSIDNISPWR